MNEGDHPWIDGVDPEDSRCVVPAAAPTRMRASSRTNPHVSLLP
ncbi:unnamed protein product [Strongylus vulgaris]|uniref:Uncharacterized protein n=1 Tax=Strongylus vulgaris TaxID=40348 RepID=A0A3P7J8W4_STRVU|nr:unnamed protein product [Strongylus vulgaris]